jgi:glycosyltransferase involved in cell wall biosynthesis
LVYAGAFEPWQGVDILLQAYKGLIEEGYPVQLTLAGDGSEYSKIIEIVHELNLQSSVRLTGPLNLEKLASILSESDIGLAPYCGWPEYSGLKLFDYKSAGLAIVVSGEDGRPKTIEHNRTGIIVRPCDVEDLKRAIARLVEDSELRRSLGQAAREEAERLHSWEHTVQQIEAAVGRIFDK